MSGRGAQTQMMKLAGWSKATMSQLFNGTQDYSPDILDAAAVALNVETYELLMHPDRAMALRRFKETAIAIASDNTQAERLPAPVSEHSRKSA